MFENQTNTHTSFSLNIYQQKNNNSRPNSNLFHHASISPIILNHNIAAMSPISLILNWACDGDCTSPELMSSRVATVTLML